MTTRLNKQVQILYDANNNNKKKQAKNIPELLKIIAKLEAVELPELNNETKWILCKVLEHQTPKDAYPEILRWRLKGNEDL